MAHPNQTQNDPTLTQPPSLAPQDPARSDPTAPSEQRWATLGIVLIGTLIVALDSTIVSVALPQIGTALNAKGDIQWIVTTNLLAVCVSMPASGWIANRIGAKTIFLLALAVFSVASLGAALAPSLGFLIAARAVQGLCSGILNPVSMTIVLDLFPPYERGRAMGIWGLASMSRAGRWAHARWLPGHGGELALALPAERSDRYPW